MLYLPAAILSYFLNSIAVTVDKFLLTKVIPDPLIYVFYFSAVSILAVLFIPFVHIPTLFVLVLASAATLFWTLGAHLMFWALKLGQVQRVIPVIGTLTPLALLVVANQTHAVTITQTIAITLLLAGLVFLTFQDWRGKLLKKELLLEVFSALFFALSYQFLKMAFNRQDFLTVFVWSKPILLPLGIILLTIPRFRKKILPVLEPKSGFAKSLISPNSALFAFGQISAGISELLLNFSISLASPAIVNSLQGVKYLFLLIFSLVLGRKFPQIFKVKTSLGFLLSQIMGIIFIVLGIYLLGFVGEFPG